MKKSLLWAIPGVLLVIVGIWYIATPYPPLSSHDVYGHSIRFEYDTSPRENEKRVEELREVLDMLPTHLVEPVGPISIVVSGKPDLCDSAWASGCAWSRKPEIGIHQRSDIEAYPFDWEHFAVDGYTHLERIKVLIHEFGHLIDFRSLEWHTRQAFVDVRKLAPDSVTSYGATALAEDFADTFTFYVLWPDYLKRYYPHRYAYMYDIFDGIEYQSIDKMPSSVLDRLDHDWPTEAIQQTPRHKRGVSFYGSQPHWSGRTCAVMRDPS